MESAWGVEHGTPVSKSLVGQNKFVPAVKLGARRLKAARAKMKNDDRWHPARSDVGFRRKMVEDAPKKKDMSYPEGPGDTKISTFNRSGVYRRRGDARTDVVNETHQEIAGALGGLKREASRVTAFQAKSGKKYPVHVVPNYPNAHPIRTGSKKGGKTEIVAGDRQMNPATMRHEVMHADNKSSWRLSQIGSRSRSLKREEARVDTLSGTYKQNTARELAAGKTGGTVSHTAGNRFSQDRGSREFRRTQDKIFRSRGQSARKESSKSGIPYVPTPGKPNASGSRRLVRYGVAGAGAGGAYAGSKHVDRKYRRDRNGKFA
jgi:hypothetical protein